MIQLLESRQADCFPSLSLIVVDNKRYTIITARHPKDDGRLYFQSVHISGGGGPRSQIFPGGGVPGLRFSGGGGGPRSQ